MVFHLLSTAYEKRVSHYYGNEVRQLFIAASTVMLLGAPLYSDAIRVHLPFLVVGVLILVALAAFTNPHKKTTMMANATAAGAGLLVYETWALFDFSDGSWIEFALRQIIAFIFLAAFYYSLKTLRAMVLGKIGKHAEVGEFDAPKDRVL